jgi:hypothetical protein
MTMLRQIWAAVWGMFVDDGALAVQVVALVALVAAATWVLPPLWAAGLLVPGCLLILVTSVWRAKAKHGPR